MPAGAVLRFREQMFVSARSRTAACDSGRRGVADENLQLMTVSANDVADELRRRLPGLGVVKLHKLLYYAQGWHLAWVGKPMFREPIKAWDNGPVVAELWADEKHGRGRPQPEELSGSQISTLDYVLERYGSLTGEELVRRTHNEDPWVRATDAGDRGAMGSRDISQEALCRWFEKDDDYIAYQAEVDKFRQRTDIYGFGPRPITPELEAAVLDAINHKRMQDARSR
jgi:uncharacterized phage-associated protein